MVKRFLRSHHRHGAGHWQPQLAQALIGHTLGLVGLGNIGQQMARIGQAFGMDVIAWSPNLTPDRAQAAGVRCDTRVFPGAAHGFFNKDVEGIPGFSATLADADRFLVSLGWLKAEATP